MDDFMMVGCGKVEVAGSVLLANVIVQVHSNVISPTGTGVGPVLFDRRMSRLLISISSGWSPKINF
ncbi:hypothetical protein BDR06DRAFT_58610 [Suillus hirtellus]|nr:hypothetical protein BDR06DRAFT_58610 [Suillus hirtellus]